MTSPAPPSTTADDQRAAAIARLQSKRQVTGHLVAFLSISALLVIIWAATGAGSFWPVFPIAGLALALGLHAWSVYGQKPISEDEIQEEIARGVPPTQSEGTAPTQTLGKPH